jgi:small subunit ribosomal protein S2
LSDLSSLLIEKLLENSQVNVSSVLVSKDMKRYVVSRLPNGKSVFDIKAILSAITTAGKMISRQNNPFFYSSSFNFKQALPMLNKLCKISTHFGRFLPGTFTNPSLSGYQDTDLLILGTPNFGQAQVRTLRSPTTQIVTRVITEEIHNETRAVEEAVSCNIPIMAFCNSRTITAFIDVVIPLNTDSPRAVAVGCYLLCRSILINRGQLREDEDPPFTVSDFEYRGISP